jgi:cytochrome c-type biogenesis protein CcmH/NrfG
VTDAPTRGFLAAVALLGVVAVASFLVVRSGLHAEAQPFDHEREEAAAVAALQDLVEARPDDVEARLRLAHRYFDDRAYDEALAHYLVILDGQRQPEALSHAAWIAFQSGDARAADRLLAESLQRAPDNPETLWFLAHVRLYGFDDARGAVAALETLLDAGDTLSPGLRAQVRTLLTEARAR